MPPKRNRVLNKKKENKTSPQKRLKRPPLRHWGLLMEDGLKGKTKFVFPKRKGKTFKLEELHKHIKCSEITLVSMGTYKETKLPIEVYGDDEGMMKANSKQNRLVEILFKKKNIKGNCLLISKDNTFLKKMREFFDDKGNLKPIEKEKTLFDYIELQ